MCASRLDIRYVKLHFCIEYTEDCRVPVNKTSALRGGMGEILCVVCGDDGFSD